MSTDPMTPTQQGESEMVDYAENPAVLPRWSEGRPDKPGSYIGFSSLPSRLTNPPSLYHFNGSVFQHWTGWYDGGVTHWMPTDLPDPFATPTR